MKTIGLLATTTLGLLVWSCGGDDGTSGIDLGGGGFDGGIGANPGTGAGGQVPMAVGGGGTTSTGGGGPGSCVPGASNACTCTDGRSGAQVCNASGTFDACTCAGSQGGSGGGGGTTSADGGGLGGATGDASVPGSVAASCAQDSDCDAGLICYRGGTGPSAQAPGYCTVGGCVGDSGATCIDPATGTVPATCSQFDGDVCILDCSTGTCPDGMQCDVGTFGQVTLSRCNYPVTPPTSDGGGLPDGGGSDGGGGTGGTGGTGSGGADSGSSSGAALYEACGAGCANGLTCSQFWGYCTEACVTAGDCTVPSTGNATVNCSNFTNTCTISCTGGATCPDGMTCNVTQFGSFCGI